jgi:hypothetical protein
MLWAPFRAALNDDARIADYLLHGDTGRFGGGIYAGAEKPGLPHELWGDDRSRQLRHAGEARGGAVPERRSVADGVSPNNWR